MRANTRLLIGGPVNGGILAAVIWWVLNDAWKVGGVGILQQQPWPLSSIYACAAIGAVLGMALGVTLVLVGTAHASRVAALCQRLHFQYIPVIAREQITCYHGLRLFESSRWHEARNLMRGSIDGEKLELLDYEYVEHGDEATTHYRQTVTLFADCGGTLPRFDLVPRGFIIKLFYQAVGLEGVTFEAGENMSDWDRDVIERFRQSYFLSPSFAEVLRSAHQRRLSSEQGRDGTNDAQPEFAEPAIRQLFNLELLRFFADRPGWSVESDGRSLAVWRRKKIIPAGERDGLLREASELRAALRKAASGETRAPTIPGTLKLNLRAVGTHDAAWTIGVFVGFFVGGLFGMALAGTLFFAFADPPFLLLGGVFFACPIAGFVIGGLIGYRWQRKPPTSHDPKAAEDIFKPPQKRGS